MRLATHVFLKEDRTATCDRHVVEHVASLGAIQQGRNGAAKFGVGNVGEAEAIEPAAADLGADAIFDLVVTVGGDEVVVTRVVRVPLAVLGAKELGAPVAVAEGLQLGCGQTGDVALILEAKGAVERRVAVLVGGASAVGNQPVNPDDEEVADAADAHEARAFNDITSGLLLANPEIDLAAG